MKELFAVYLESLDQNLTVFTNKEEAQKLFDEWKAAGKPVKMQVFGSHQLCALEKANGCSAKDPGFWEEMRYNNGRYILTERYSWHTEPEEEGYYAEYFLS